MYPSKFELFLIVLILSILCFALIERIFADESTLELQPAGDYLKIIESAETPKVIYEVSANCVNKQEIVDALRSLLSQAEPNQSNVTLTNCATCECWHNGGIGSASYYECKAAEARDEEKYFNEKRELIKRIESDGVCP